MCACKTNGDFLRAVFACLLAREPGAVDKAERQSGRKRNRTSLRAGECAFECARALFWANISSRTHRRGTHRPMTRALALRARQLVA